MGNLSVLGTSGLDRSVRGGGPFLYESTETTKWTTTFILNKTFEHLNVPNENIKNNVSTQLNKMYNKSRSYAF